MASEVVGNLRVARLRDKLCELFAALETFPGVPGVPEPGSAVTLEW